MIQVDFIDMEKMFALLDEVETVQDAPDATEMVVSKGHVVFGNYLESMQRKRKENLICYMYR